MINHHLGLLEASPTPPHLCYRGDHVDDANIPEQTSSATAHAAAGFAS